MRRWNVLWVTMALSASLSSCSEQEQGQGQPVGAGAAPAMTPSGASGSSDKPGPGSSNSGATTMRGAAGAAASTDTPVTSAMGAQPNMGMGAATGSMNMMGGSAPAAPAGGNPGAVALTGGSDTDYSKPEYWLCRPGLQNDACSGNLNATIVEADGTMTEERFMANPDAPIDCFYVYPTISNDTTPNSDLSPGPEERGTAANQFARFGSQCRLFAPVYRQRTLTALTSGLSGSGMPVMSDPNLGFSDVIAAIDYYLEHDNNGRGVVFIGHSQGSGVLSRVLAQFFDKSPADSRFVAALLIGTRVEVQKGAKVGGTFKNLPLCTKNEELGCIVTYASFRSTVPPPADSRFAGSMTDGGCTNPAKLEGGSAELDAYLSARGGGLGSAMAGPWVTSGQPITTPYVKVPGLLTGECVSNDNGTYFEITVHGDPADPRVDDITGDIMMNGQVAASWGLHLIDTNLAMGDLVRLVGAKGAAYTGGAAMR